ncbi:MAG TPA: 5-deoxy-glucuronate isomerase [Pyrinomonadaceae bacterium]
MEQLCPVGCLGGLDERSTYDAGDQTGDVLCLPKGYHPNVAAPGGQINFLWMMAAVREGEDRQFGVVNVQPEYAASGSGLEAARQELAARK